MLFTTISGSRYEVDQNKKRIRRLLGSMSPTNRQGKDGEWKQFFSISPIVEGKSVVIIWVDETLLPETVQILKDTPSMVVPMTTTSSVSRRVTFQ